MAQASKTWRQAAKEFVGPSVTRYEDFEQAWTMNSESDQAHLQKMLQQADTILSEVRSAHVVSKEERMQELKKSLKDFQKRQRRLENRQKQKERELLNAWEEQLEEKRQLASARREETQQRLLSARQDAMTSRSERASNTTFLTQEGHIPPRLAQRIRVLKPDKSQLVVWKQNRDNCKPRLPPEAMQTRRKKKEFRNYNSDQGKCKLAQFAGLRKNAEGMSILRDPEVVPETPRLQKAMLRKHQMQLMNQMTDHIHFYRKHLAHQFQKIVDVTELQFEDAVGKRKNTMQSLDPSRVQGMKFKKYDHL